MEGGGDAEDFSTFKVKQLKEYITSRGGSLAGLAEKADLIQRCKELQSVAPTSAGAGAGGANAAAPALPCDVWDSFPAGDTPDFAVILFHGLNADNSQFRGVGQAILAAESKRLGGKKVRVISPQAGSLPGSPNQAEWFELNLMEWMMAMMSGDQGTMVAQARKEPAGLADNRVKATKVLHALLAETGLPLSKVFIGGFSQGAAMAMEVALALEGSCAGVLWFSGLPVNLTAWEGAAGGHRGMKVLIMHGIKDRMIPLFAAGVVRDQMQAKGLDVRYFEHTLSPHYGEDADHSPPLSFEHVGAFVADALGL